MFWRATLSLANILVGINERNELALHKPSRRHEVVDAIVVESAAQAARPAHERRIDGRVEAGAVEQDLEAATRHGHECVARLDRELLVEEGQAHGVALEEHLHLMYIKLFITINC